MKVGSTKGPQSESKKALFRRRPGPAGFRFPNVSDGSCHSFP